MRPALKLALATALFGIVHSALASRTAKRAAARLLGPRAGEGTYRVLFNAQAVVTMGALVLYARGLPSRTLYRASGPAAWLLRSGQLLGLAHAFWAAREVGVLRITGLERLWAWTTGREIPVAPIAQGPERDPATGALTDGGPFRWSRHPLNLSPLPVFWLTPHLTTNRLAFNLVGSVYLVLGSVHEELRLREAYGLDYLAYERGGVPFYLPRTAPTPPRALARPAGARHPLPQERAVTGIAAAPGSDGL